MVTQLHRVRRLLPVVVLSLVFAVPIDALASHSFTDVPTNDPFHADIAALKDSYVSPTGCGGGNFCPDAFVTRGQMAAFLNRLGALGPGEVPVANATKLDGLDSTQFARSDVPVTGHVNCMGISMQPWASGMTYTASATGRYIISGSGYFNCPVVLPDGATITALRAGVYDAHATGLIACYILAVSPDFVAVDYSPATTPDSGDTPGYTVLEDDTISQPLVDNGAYSYMVECELSAAGADLVLRGVSVEYTVTGLPVN